VGASNDWDVLEKKYRGMKASIMADFQVPIVEERTEIELVSFIVKWFEKCLDNKRTIVTEHHIPPIYKGGQNERLLMCIKGISTDRAKSIISTYGNVAGVLSKLKEYNLDVSDIGPKTVFSMIDQFREWGMITKDDVYDMPMTYAIDRLGYKGKDKKVMSAFNRIRDLGKDDEGYLYDRLQMLVEQGR